MSPPADQTTLLWRPTGAAELALVAALGWKAWPPRLPEQPIFYPVTNEAYAVQIARDWNTKEPSKVGHVTRFAVRNAFLGKYEKQIVGARMHEEYWIPADQLDDLNANVVGLIELVATYTEQDRLTYEAKARTNA